MLRVKLGIDNPTTALMMATTTSSSVKVKPACDATRSRDLAVDSTSLLLRLISFKNLPQACHGTLFVFAVGGLQVNLFALKSANESMTFVAELLYPKHTNPGTRFHNGNTL